MKNTGNRLSLIAASAVLAIGTPLSYGSLIFTAGLSSITSPNQMTGDDPNPVDVTMPAFTFYGTSYTGVRVTCNGAVGFTLGGSGLLGTSYDNSFSPWTVTAGRGPAIGVLWDDWNSQQTTKYGVSVIAGGNTYNNAWSLTFPQFWTYGDSSKTLSAQITLFSGAANVALLNGHSFSFQAGDIALSYGDSITTPSGFSGGRAAVGVTNGSGTYAAMPGSSLTTPFEVTSPSLMPTGERFVLFRWNSGTANYAASIETFAAVPEPQTLALVMGLAALGLVMVRRRRS